MGILLFVDRKATDPRHYFTLVDPATGATEDHWVALRSELSDAEASRIQSAMIASATVNDAGAMEMKLDLAGARAVKLATWIAEWSFGGADGRAAPADRRHLDLLPTWVADVLMGIVDEHAEAFEATRAARRFTKDDAPSPLALDGYATHAPTSGQIQESPPLPVT